jgi:hypothetical protein
MLSIMLMQEKSHPDEIAGDCGVIPAVLKATNRSGDAEAFHSVGLCARLDYADEYRMKSGGFVYCLQALFRNVGRLFPFHQVTLGSCFWRAAL